MLPINVAFAAWRQDTRAAIRDRTEDNTHSHIKIMLNAQPARTPLSQQNHEVMAAYLLAGNSNSNGVDSMNTEQEIKNMDQNELDVMIGASFQPFAA